MAFENDQADLMHDVRLVEHHIRRQLLTPAEHRKHLGTLEDSAEHGTETETRFASLWEHREGADEE